MGPIYDRSREHLGTTEGLIIRTRRRWINAAKALAENRTAPPGAEDAAIYGQRSGTIILPRSVDWWEATKERRRGFVKHEGLTPMVI